MLPALSGGRLYISGHEPAATISTIPEVGHMVFRDNSTASPAGDGRNRTRTELDFR